MTTAGRDTTCRRCGAPVLAVRVDYLNTPVLLDDHELPITTDLADLIPEAQAWRYLGPRIGWEPLHVAARDWRPIRGTHDCRGEHENKKEHKQ